MRRVWSSGATAAAQLQLVIENVVGWRSYSTASKFRIARKSYEPGEKIPMPGDKSRIQMEVPSSPGINDMPNVTTSSSFNATMTDIVKGGSKKKKIALEGQRLIEDALLAGLRMEKLFMLKTIKEVPQKISTLMTKDVEVQKVGQKQMELWSSVTTPPGVIGIFPKPTNETISKWTAKGSKLPLTVVCDNVREPGNLGSILRSAAGAGCRTALLSKGSVDPWDGKVLRGGSGAHFRLPIVTDVSMYNIQTYFDLTHQSKTSNPPCIGIFIADSNVDAEARCGIPSVSYQSIDYRRFTQILLLIGGESEGVGDGTFRELSTLAKSFSASGVSVDLSRIHISLDNDVESLNVANAFGIIVFEIRRQFESTVSRLPKLCNENNANVVKK